MTGQKNRFKTTEKLWDLDDKQLKTPKHDAMVLWLMDKDNYSLYLNFKNVIMVGSDKYSLAETSVLSEVPIMSSPTFIAGYADLKITGKYVSEIGGYRYFINHVIEVKPKIESFGAVLRQVNSYKKFMNNANNQYYIFTLDSRFDSQFESQGIKVLHPPEDITIEDMVKMYGL